MVFLAHYIADNNGMLAETAFASASKPCFLTRLRG